MTAAALTFGSVPLLSPSPPWADYAIEATADGTTWGNPAAVVATVASMLMDGEKSKITRFGNREAAVPLQIRGSTLDAVAAGEAEVMAEVNKGRNTLTWSPPGWSTPSVFDVVYAVLDFKYDDLAEKDQVTRFFTLTFYCLPFARRETITSLAFPASGKQQTVNATNPGTARTDVDIAIEGTALGDQTIVYTAGVGEALTPPMRARFSAPTTGVSTDASTVSGKRHLLTSPTIATIPVADVPPGVYQIVARLRHAAGAISAPVDWHTFMSDAPWDLQLGDETGTTGVFLKTDWANRVIANVVLPPVNASTSASSAASVNVQLFTGTAGVEIDEFWLFNIDTGVLSMAPTDFSPASASRLFIASATIDRETPDWFMGTAGTDADDTSIAGLMDSPGIHQFPAGDVQITVVTPGGGAGITAEFYDRYQHHVPSVS